MTNKLQKIRMCIYMRFYMVMSLLVERSIDTMRGSVHGNVMVKVTVCWFYRNC